MKRLLLNPLCFILVASLFIFNSCQKGQAFKSDIVNGPKPTSSFTYANTDTNAMSINFISTGINVQSAYWQFGDGTTSTVASPVHTYATPGKYAVILKVNSAAGYSATSTQLVTAIPPASIVTYSTNDFEAGTEITLTGYDFAVVTSVKVKTTGALATIVSQNDSTLVLKMPQTTATESPLLFTYSSGSTIGGTVTSTVIFNDLDNGYVFFDDNFENGWYSNSWGPVAISNTIAKTGTNSIGFTYPQYSNWADGFGNNSPLDITGYTYLSFWIKGGTENYTLYLTADTRPYGFWNSDQSMPITVPANVWTYFKLPLSTLSLQGSAHFGFWIPGPMDRAETFYLDDVALIK